MLPVIVSISSVSLTVNRCLFLEVSVTLPMAAGTSVAQVCENPALIPKPLNESFVCGFFGLRCLGVLEARIIALASFSTVRLLDLLALLPDLFFFDELFDIVNSPTSRWHDRCEVRVRPRVVTRSRTREAGILLRRLPNLFRGIGARNNNLLDIRKEFGDGVSSDSTRDDVFIHAKRICSPRDFTHQLGSTEHDTQIVKEMIANGERISSNPKGSKQTMVGQVQS